MPVYPGLPSPEDRALGSDTVQTTRPMAIPDILALDIDGVLCDGMRE